MFDSQSTPPRSERRDAAENRQRILDAALRLFEQQGVEQVSMNQIAAEAQIGPGTLYRRYRNKAELCTDLMKENIILLFDNIEAYLNDNKPEPAIERLKGILNLFIRFREKKSQLLAGVEESTTTNRSRSRTHGPLYLELHQLLVDLFDEMADSGKARPNSVFKADMLLMALSSDSYSFQRTERGYSPELFLEQICLTFDLNV
ncbi:TetR/AcrR family transcriptional regulator [Paenibacillus sacheonensis]|uniref:TetR family transcriptional regulator n=1 Tax=Paenibacillus sacheonensis TaxID=742054 RepID=A0A7X5BZH7_9BACL|nr:TetR/AcrR family transcriptional regulator [Paenibacillus sacheonensis]MBM7567839.1 AcrR family transcriptional regulator [Paenibacillus sacheonensis]NBC70727.1 TetR family transcriptional regulator [Paenibacillus sacheonensis]